MTTPTNSSVQRIHTSWMANRERQLLIFLARHLPRWVSSDMLTALGLSGAALAGLAFVACWLSDWFVLLACAGLVLNWFGDSLDGTVARERGQTRPVYGFFVDHSVDVIAQVFLFIGLGLSPLMRLDAACLLLLSYWLATLLTMIRAVAVKRFQISYYGIGPTEIRLALVLYSLAVLAIGPIKVPTMFGPMSLIDLASGLIFAAVFAAFLVQVWTESRRLNLQDPPPGNDPTGQG